MDKKTKQRILGVLVVIGLVIILLPFLQSEKGLPTETTVLKAPPFPDQAVQVTSQATTEIQEIKPPSKFVENNQTQTDMQQLPDDTIRVVRPSVINAKAPVLTGEIPATRVNPKTDEELKPSIEQEKKAIELPAEKLKKEEDIKMQLMDEKELMEPDEPAVEPGDKAPKAIRVVKNTLDNDSDKKSFKPQIKPFVPATNYAHKEKAKFASSDGSTFDKNGLAKLQDPAWVIQIGSFKNKANALRLVNQLRSNGYKAFIQQISTSFGDSTRVFVGPESKHTAARELANQLENDLHIHGIVISYKPLAL